MNNYTNTNEELEKFGKLLLNDKSKTLEFIQDINDKKNNIIDDDWSDIKDKYQLEGSKDIIRRYGDLVLLINHHNLLNSIVTNTDYLDLQIEEKQEELTKMKMKLSTIKTKHNKFLRKEAREELNWETLFEEVSKKIIPIVNVPEVRVVAQNPKKSLLPLADMHFGAELLIKGLYDETINEYNQKVFEARMWRLRDVVVEYVRINSIDELYITLLGDLVDGMLRLTQLSYQELSVVDSIIELSAFLSEWVNDLSKYVNIKVYSAYGNHSEARFGGTKAGDLLHENLEKLIWSFMKKFNKNNKNIDFVKANKHCLIEIDNLKILIAHGDWVKSESALQDFEKFYNIKLDMVIMGHKHHLYNKSNGGNENGNIEVLQVQSMIGTCEYSANKLLKRSNAGCTLLVFDKNLDTRIKADINLQNILN